MGTLVGTKVGRFRVDRELGRGGMGAVYAAFDERLEREVALKVLLARDANEEEQRRFVREARLAAKLTHPNIASVYEVDQIEGRIVIIMELLEGESLRKTLSTRRLTVEEAVMIARDIARALARAHANGIVHRDIKPENVFVTEPAPGALHAKVLDFGLARQRDPALSMAGGPGNEFTMSQTWGTPGYMSPEQANRQAVDARTDVFAFGALLYEMLAGIRAFRAANDLGVLAAVLRSEPRALSQIVPDVSPTLEAIVVKCLKKDRADRYADGRDLSAALEQFVRPMSTGSFQIDPSRISSPDLSGARPSTPGLAAAPSSPSTRTMIDSTPSHASVTTTKNAPSRPFALPAMSTVTAQLRSAVTALSSASSSALVALRKVDLRDRRMQQRAAVAAGSFVGLVVLLVVVLSRGGSPTPGTVPSGSVAASPPAVTVDPDPFVVPPPPPVATEAEPVETETDLDEPATTAAPVPSASHAAAPIPVRTAKPPKNKAADCKTPFTIDSKGVKIPKMHCLQ